MRDSFIFYRSFYEALSELENEDKLQIYEAISEYSLNQTITELKGVAKAIFTLIKPQIDANLQRYENGKKGGRPRNQPKPKDNQEETKPKPNVNVNVNVNDNDNVNENEQDDKNNIFEFLEKNFGRTISPIEYEKIIEWEKHFSEDIIKHAISESCLNNAKTMNYLTTILQDWKSKGFTKLSEIEDRNKNKKKKLKRTSIPMRLENEKSLLAYLIVYPEDIPTLQIKPKYLSDYKNKTLLEQLITHYQKYKKISLAKLIEENKNFDNNYYFELIADQHYENTLSDYEEIVLNHYKQDILKNLNQKLNSKEITFPNFIEKIKQIDDVQIVKAKKLDAEEIKDNLKSNVRINLNNFKKLNATLRLVRNDFVIVGATTGAGKSSFLINLMNDLMENYQCIYFNLEMAKSTIYQRMIAIKSGIPVDHVASPKTEYQKEIIEKTINELDKKNLIVEHQVSEIKQIRSLIAKEKSDKHTIVFIDHLGLISVAGNKSIYEKATEIAKTLRQISLNYDCTIIGASQLNRSAYSAEQLNLAMLKDSGEMENSASKVLLLHKQESLNEEEKISQLDVEVAKNRDGLVGFIKLKYEKKKQIFSEVEEWKQQT